MFLKFNFLGCRGSWRYSQAMAACAVLLSSGEMRQWLLILISQTPETWRPSALPLKVGRKPKLTSNKVFEVVQGGSWGKCLLRTGMLGVESCQLSLFDEDWVNVLLKWPIKCERKRTGAGFPLQKYFWEVGRWMFLDPWMKEHPSWREIFLSSFSLWPLVRDRRKLKLLLVPHVLIV